MIDKILCLTFFLFLSGCSKEQGQAPILVATPLPTTSSESGPANDLISAKKTYFISFDAFRKSTQKKMNIQKLAFEKYITSASVYLKSLSSESQDYKNIAKAYKNDLRIYENLKTRIKRLANSRKSHGEIKQRLDFIKKKTNNFQLNLISEHGLRDETYSLIQNYEKSSSFLKLTFPRELTQVETGVIDADQSENEKFKILIAPYLKAKEELDQAEKGLEKVDFNFNRKDHIIAGLTYESIFFKALEEYAKANEELRINTAEFLSVDDLKNINNKNDKISSTIFKLKKMKNMQEDVRNSLLGLSLLGYRVSSELSEHHIGKRLFWLGREAEQVIFLEFAKSSDKPDENDYKRSAKIFSKALTQVNIYQKAWPDTIIPERVNDYWLGLNALLTSTHAKISYLAGEAERSQNRWFDSLPRTLAPGPVRR